MTESTPDWLAELQENLELARVSPFEALEQLPVLLAHIASQAGEIERLRRERDSVVNIAAAALDHVRKRYNGDSDSFGDIEEALLDAGFTMDDLDAIPGLGQAREDVLASLSDKGGGGE